MPKLSVLSLLVDFPEWEWRKGADLEGRMEMESRGPQVGEHAEG